MLKIYSPQEQDLHIISFPPRDNNLILLAEIEDICRQPWHYTEIAQEILKIIYRETKNTPA